MTTTPRITKGLGKLTPDIFARTMRAVEHTESQPTLPRRAEGPVAQSFLARLGAATPANSGVPATEPGYADNGFIWRYDFTQVVTRWHDDSETYPKLTKVDYPGGITGTSGGAEDNSGAFNIVEILNTETNAGPGVELSDTISPSPVEVGTVVVMYAVWDPGGDSDHANYFYLFAQDNPFSCDESEGAPLASRVMDLDLGTFVSATLSGSNIDFGAFS